jgi:DNA invertase Pin-like site-specific DNA recombinase
MAPRTNCDYELSELETRFGRSLRHLVNALAEIEAFGVAFISLRDNLDFSDLR